MKTVLHYILLLSLLTTTSIASAQLTGAIFTTDSTCTGVNLNIYSNKEAVYLDGGPASPKPDAAGLPDGYYYVQITDPSGSPVLGTSVGSGNDTPVHVTNGVFDQCYQLWNILIKTSDSSQGYDTTPNPGGEYKVWVSTVSTFNPDDSKTDNFKVKSSDTCPPDCPPPPQATLNVVKFYDANANGTNDDNQSIIGWMVRIQDNIDYIRYTSVHIVVDPDTYTITEFLPIQNNWKSTTQTLQEVILSDGDEKTVEFGNLCLGAGGGLTLGFWSNKNGQALIGSDDLQFLRSLNLRDATGSDFDPITNNQFRTWILSANATNMAYMLSAQLAAMELNVYNGKVNGNSIIYAPGINSSNPLGYATVNSIMTEANESLGTNGYTVAQDSNRSYQEALKNALDKANNNYTFVQPTPCQFSF